MVNQTPISLRVYNDLLERLNDLAERMNVPRQRLINRAIRDFLDEQELLLDELECGLR